MIYKIRKPNKIKKQKIFPKVTLVIPTFNEEKVIFRKLENLENLEYPRDNIEVLIIDSGSTDNTQKLIQNFINNKNNGKIKLDLVLQQKRLGKAIALNCVWSQCKNEVVIISDADTLFRKDSVSKIVQNFADPSVGAVTGKLIILDSKKSSMTKLEEGYRRIFDNIRLGESRIDSTPIFNGPIMAFRKDLFDNLRSDTIADDTELSLKTRKKGFKTIYDPQAIAYEYTPTGFKSTAKQKTRRAQGIIQSFLRHKSFFFNPIFGKFGFIIFPCEFFMNIISPFIIVLILILITINIFIKPIIILIFTILIISFLILSFSIILIQKILKQNENSKIDLIRMVSTFLSHQLFLFLGFFSLISRRTNYKWEKIEDVRTRDFNEVNDH